VSQLKKEPVDFEPLEISSEKFKFGSIDRIPNKFIDYIGGYLIKKVGKNKIILNYELVLLQLMIRTVKAISLMPILRVS